MEIEKDEDAEYEEDEQENIAQQKLFSEGDEEDTPKKRTVNIWKVALWGTSYDYILLQHLRNKNPTLKQVLHQKKGSWISKVGFNHSGPGKFDHALWLDEKPYVTPKDFTRYGIDMRKLQPLPKGQHYYRRGLAAQFNAP